MADATKKYELDTLARNYIGVALDAKIAQVKRAQTAQTNPEIKRILQNDINALQTLRSQF